MRILGIDPGSTSMGYAVLDEVRGELRVVAYGTTTIAAKDLPGKLLLLDSQLATIIRAHSPAIAGVERLFLARNKKTAFEVAHARGVIMLSLLKSNIPTYEITPNEVKIAVTNYGGSDKQMVAKMVMKILGLPKLSGDDNAADALAVAIATAGLARTSHLV